MAASSNGGSSRDHASSFLAGLNLPPQPSSEARDSRDRRHDDKPPRDSYRDHRRDGHRSDRGRDGDRYGDRYDRDRRDRDRGDRDRFRDRDAPRRDDRHDRPRDDRDKSRPSTSSKSKGPREAIPEGTEPISKRKRKVTMWDVKPVGYPNMTPGQAKLSGIFPLPGQPRPVGQASLMRGLLDGAGTQAREARRLYVGGIPENVNEQELLDFFNKTMTEQKLTISSEPAAISVQLGSDKTYAFVEFNAPEEATAAVAFDGMIFQEHTLKVRRPKDYVETTADDYGVHIPGVISTNVPDTPNKVFIGGLPVHLNEEQVMELLKAFGELRAFNLVKDTNGVSKGFAFCEYVDHSITDIACENLNNMELLDKRLIVQRASVGGRGGPVSTAAAGSAGLPIPLALLRGDSEEVEPTRVMQLLNLMSLEEAQDPMDHQEICEDVRTECEKFGQVLDMKAPRPAAGKAIHGIGKVYVRFADKDSCRAAVKALGGRQFDMRTVITGYFNEEKYEREDFEALHVV